MRVRGGAATDILCRDLLESGAEFREACAHLRLGPCDFALELHSHLLLLRILLAQARLQRSCMIAPVLGRIALAFCSFLRELLAPLCCV